LELYDEDEKGLITIDDLREAFTYVEIYDAKDKHSFDCFSIMMLRKNSTYPNMIKISDVMESLFDT